MHRSLSISLALYIHATIHLQWMSPHQLEREIPSTETTHWYVGVLVSSTPSYTEHTWLKCKTGKISRYIDDTDSTIVKVIHFSIRSVGYLLNAASLDLSGIPHHRLIQMSNRHIWRWGKTVVRVAIQEMVFSDNNCSTTTTSMISTDIYVSW